jgi:hypothetical protein
MAIELAENFHGITVPNAYHRLDRLIGEHKKGLIAQITTYTDATHAAANDPIGSVRTFNFDWPNPPTADFVGYIYKQLMAMPEFAGGVAV